MDSVNQQSLVLTSNNGAKRQLLVLPLIASAINANRVGKFQSGASIDFLSIYPVRNDEPITSCLISSNQKDPYIA